MKAVSVKNKIRTQTLKIRIGKLPRQTQIAPILNVAVLTDVLCNDLHLFVAEIRMAHQLFERGFVHIDFPDFGI